MFFLSQDGMRLVESSYLYINESSIFAVINGGEDVELAHFDLYGAAQEALRSVYPAIEDSEAVFSFAE